ncbi:MAG: hypothetical protein O3A51_06940 [Verrucomicrobia bacterium]|nr:hypothetical protein [Verrucomicrobiota bacterium]
MKISQISYVAVTTLTLSACATHISPRDADISASKQPLGTFQYYAIKPVTVTEGKKVHEKWIAAIERNLKQCMPLVFKDIHPFDESAVAAQPRALVIEPLIVDLKGVSVAKRIFLGPLPGSSAALVQVKFIDQDTRAVIADPTFFSKGNAWGGAFTFGTTDALMLTRTANEICDYSRKNY